jgi:hypothetical protein
MINYLLGLLLFLFVACEPSKPVVVPDGTPDVDTSVPNSPTGEPPIIEPDPATLPTPVPQPEPVVNAPSPSAVEFSLSGVKLVGANAAQTDKYAKAMKVVASVLKDPEFKKKVLAHRDFENTTDSQATVLKKLFEGSETYKAAKIDRTAQLEVRFYYAANSTVGYTYPKVGYIMVNTKFFNGYTPSSVAANFIHEYLHKLGYGHDSSATARRPYSVPYGIGGIMRSLGKKYE